MSDPGSAGDLAALEPLEPLDVGSDMAGGSQDALLQAVRSGLACPAFNPYCRDKSYYKFLFAGVIMLVGTMMPFSANTAVAGYQTMSGGFYLLFAIGMIWTWWGAIANNRSTGASLKWLGFCAIALIATAWNLASFDPEAAHKVAVAHGWMTEATTYPANWKAMFGDIGSALAKSQEAADRVGNFWRLLGTGQFFVFLGALIAELGFLGGILGGAKQNKLEKQARIQAAAERKRK
jgi:hypothetical protein